MLDGLAQVVLAELGHDVVKRADLCRLTGRSDREVRGAVAELRRHGHLVVTADGGGYRLAQSVDEVRAYTKSLIRRVWVLNRTIAAMEDSAAESFGGGGNGSG